MLVPSPGSKTILFLLMCAVMLAAPMPGQQPGSGQGGGRGKGNRWGDPTGDEPKYDPKTVTTVSGIVQDVGTHTSRRGTSRTQISIKTADRVVVANLGPSVFLNEKRLKLAKGEAVTVTGSMVKHEGEESLLAREIKTGSQTFVLRSEDGSPKWEERHR